MGQAPALDWLDFAARGDLCTRPEELSSDNRHTWEHSHFGVCVEETMGKCLRHESGHRGQSHRGGGGAGNRATSNKQITAKESLLAS